MSTDGAIIRTDPSTLVPQRKKNWLLNRNFAWLASGQAISNMGDFVYSTTLLIWVFSLNGSAAAVSGVLVAEYVPVFVLGAIAGVFVDRWHRLRTMLASDLARVVIALLPILVPGNLRLPAIYLSVFLISSISRFFMPALSGVIQVIVPEQEQPQAASISQVTQALAIIIGPALASPLYFILGPFVAILINAGSYGVSAFCLWRMRVSKADMQPATLQDTRASGSIGAILREMRAGLVFVLKTRIVLVLIILGMVGMFGAGAINSLDIIFVSQRLHANTNLYGYLTAVSGIGMLVGAICAGLLAKYIRARRMVAGSLLALGIGLALYALQTQFVWAMVLAFFLSMPQGTLNVGVAPIFMSSVPRNLMGRVQSLFNTASFGSSLLAIALCGYLGLFIPSYLLLLGGSVLIIISGFFGWIALPAPAPTASKTEEPD